MGVVAFAGDQFRLAVVIDIVPRQRVALRELLIDQVLPPGRGAVGLGLQLFMPIEPIVMPVPPDDVIAPTLVKIEKEEGATGMRKLKVVVIRPGC